MSINEKMKKYLNQQIQKEKKRTQELQELLECKEQIQKYKEGIRELEARYKASLNQYDALLHEFLELRHELNASIQARRLLENELQELKKKKVHKKIITFSPLSDSEIQKISQE